MIFEIIIVGIIITLVIVAIFIFWVWRRGSAPASFRKSIENGMSKVSIKANADMDEIIVEDSADEEKLTFLRSNLKSGESVEFVYPASMAKAHIILRFAGKEETADVETS